jgi:SPIRAL1-like protein
VDEVKAGTSTADMEGGNLRNNYTRPEGQNVGNFLSDRCSSRVLAPPGGGSSIVFGDDAAGAAAPAAERRTGRAPGALAPSAEQHSMSSNNYARPDGQNCGNFLTDRKVRQRAAGGGRIRCRMGAHMLSCMVGGGECCAAVACTCRFLFGHSPPAHAVN